VALWTPKTRHLKRGKKSRRKKKTKQKGKQKKETKAWRQQETI
jgi:hypothetical protein